MDNEEKNKFKQVILEYIDKTNMILNYIRSAVYYDNESQIMQDMLELFFTSKLYVFENCLYALEENLISRYLGNVVQIDVDYNIEFIARFEAIREINYEFQRLL